MKKKASTRVKRSAATRKKTKPVKGSSRRAVKISARPQPKHPLREDPRFAQAVENYEAALKAVQDRKFERAKSLLQKAIEGPSTELADRAAVHLKLCNQQLARSSTAFKSPEEHYDFAVSLMNQGKYDDARAHLEKILKQNPKADYALYGLAVLDCLTSKVEDSLRHLDEAIRLNPKIRFQARNDSDFHNLADDPRFTELLYPEPGMEFTPPLPR
jgi:tetratricopeptide (TPR) repeat protein